MLDRYYEFYRYLLSDEEYSDTELEDNEDRHFICLVLFWFVCLFVWIFFLDLIHMIHQMTMVEGIGHLQI